MATTRIRTTVLAALAAALIGGLAVPHVRAEVWVDLRLPGGGNTVAITDPTQDVAIDLWVTLAGQDADSTNDGLWQFSTAIMSSNGGLVLGNLNSGQWHTFNVPFPPYLLPTFISWGASAYLGDEADIDHDGDTDIGPGLLVDDPSAAHGAADHWVVGQFQEMNPTLYQETMWFGPDYEVAHYIFDSQAWGPDAHGVTRLFAVPRSTGTIWNEDGYTGTGMPPHTWLPGTTTYGAADAGQEIILYAPATAADPGGGQPVVAGFAQDLVLDASDSGGSINTYRWDLDGDGAWDVTAGDPVTLVPWADLLALGLVPGDTYESAALGVAWIENGALTEDTTTFTLQVTPEPATLALLAIGLGALLVRKRRLQDPAPENEPARLTAPSPVRRAWPTTATGLIAMAALPVLFLGGAAMAGVADYQVSYRLDGLAEQQHFGWSASLVGDLDGNGIEDLAIGAPAHNGPVSSAWVFSQATTGAWPLLRVDTDVAHRLLGFAVAGVGDVNGDGVPDVAASIPASNRVLWISGADRNVGGAYQTHPGVIHMETGLSDTYDFCQAMDSLGPGGELLGASRPSTSGPGTHIVWYTSSGGAVTQKLKIVAYLFSADPAVRNVGDVVGDDGLDDFLFSSSDTTDGTGATFEHRGRVHLISGATPMMPPVLVQHIEESHFDGPRPNTDIGGLSPYGQNPMAAIQDVTGDGRPDFAVGGAHPIALPAVATAGAVYFYDGVTGGFLWELSKPAFIEGAFGAMVENVGDVDGDGHDDIAIGSRSAAELGEVVFYSPWTRQTIGTLEGESAGDWFGRTIVALGDLNGDGLGDFGIGAPYADHAGTDSGSYYVYLSPEPATLSLLALGALALMRRRRAATSAGSAATPPRVRRGPRPSAP